MRTSRTRSSASFYILQPLLDGFTVQSGIRCRQETFSPPPHMENHDDPDSRDRGGPNRLPNLEGESGWVFIDHHRDGKRWRVSITSWHGRAYVRFQPWFHRDGDGWMPEKGQGFSVSLRDVQQFIDGLHALLSVAAGFDPLHDGGPCEPTR